MKNILEICLSENSLTQIVALFNFSDRTKFKRKYINPLIAEGLLTMTVSDEPNSRLQQYYTTEKGKSLLWPRRKQLTFHIQDLRCAGYIIEESSKLRRIVCFSI